VESVSSDSGWQKPARILLLTYERTDHALTSYEQNVVGVPGDRGSITRARKVRKGDWVLIRLSDWPGFRASRPALITGRAVVQGEGSPYPNLLWPAELDQQKIIYPVRIPVTFEGGPQTRSGCVNWDSLAALRLRGKDGFVLETPQQWGVKFKTNVLDDPNDVALFLDLLRRCAA